MEKKKISSFCFTFAGKKEEVEVVVSQVDYKTVDADCSGGRMLHVFPIFFSIHCSTSNGRKAFCFWLIRHFDDFFFRYEFCSFFNTFIILSLSVFVCARALANAQFLAYVSTPQFVHF